MNKFSNAYIIKAEFISDILENKIKLFSNNDILIGQEVMFGKQKTFADLVVLSNNKTYAFEIKAHNDNFKRLDFQINNYKKIFDYIYVIVTENHLEALKRLNYQNVGIITISDNGFKFIKRGVVQKSFSKEDILETIPLSYLSKKYNFKNNTPASIVRTTLLQHSQKELKQTLFGFLKYKIENKYKNFLDEKGNAIQYEDISLLSLINTKVLK